jgi:1-acyl-sn-glycerol-3-phosphate acyltransferase
LNVEVMASQRHFKASFLNWFNRGQSAHWAQEPGDFDPPSVGRTMRQLDRFFGQQRPWEVHIDGLEHMPAAPVLVVSNHSGGTTIPDAWGLAYGWYTHFGTHRPLHFLAHEWVLPFKSIGEAFARRGVLWASKTTALAALRDFSHDVVVFPGGDLDAWRPYNRRTEVEFGGRLGYARLAVQAQVPIVPVAHFGAHQTLRVLTDGRKLAQFLNLGGVARAHVFPVHLSLPFGLTVGPWPHLPWPSRLRYRFGKPIAPPDQNSEDAVQALDEAVRSVIGAQLKELDEEAGARDSRASSRAHAHGA